ncbi:MAG: DNA segregation ATPase FtsK/SpoIIIE, S-DNA-T family [Marinobacter sp. T13-3]|nr:MAG: DNA segregation ATPase FtsK/SpoIIIE, S-DNA-T family [Marinobacter sp. T13-3]
MDALALEFFLGLQAQVHGRSASGDDQRIAGVLAIVALEAERAVVQVGFVDGVVDNLGLEALGMLLHALHQFRTLDAVVVARPVVYVRGGGQLAAHFNTGDQCRVQVSPCRVYGSGVAGRTGTKNDQSRVSGYAHVCLQPEKSVRRLSRIPGAAIRFSQCGL